MGSSYFERIFAEGRGALEEVIFEFGRTGRITEDQLKKVIN